MNPEPLREMSPSETWVRGAASQLRLELTRFARTFAAFVLRPMRAAAAWSAGTQPFMNPLGFVATAAGIYWAAFGAVTVLWPIGGDGAFDTITRQLSSALGPQVHYGLLGVSMHIGLRALGSRRSAAGSLGVSFFVGGSIGLAVALLLASAAQYVGHARGTSALELVSGDRVPLALLAAAVVSYGLVCFVLVRALMGLHRAALWKAAAAAVFAVLLTSLLFGSVLPDGSYGWHPYLSVDLRSGFAIAFGFRA